ncbi:MAG: sigma-70 family RNA polymerase sigma factor [Bacteroidota bacterium]
MNEQDKEIVQRILGGEKRAFSILIDRHKAKALTLAVRILKNREDAEEVLQDAFVRVYRSLSSFEGKSSFSTWFYRIVYNRCMSALEKRKEYYISSLDEEYEDYPVIEIESGDPAPDIQLESDEFRTVVEQEIEKLPSMYGGIFTLFVIQEMSYEEIVRITGLPIGTVKARIFRARSMLRNILLKRMNPVSAFNV